MNFRLLRLQVEMVDVYTSLSLLLDSEEALGLELLEISSHRARSNAHVLGEGLLSGKAEVILPSSLTDVLYRAI